MESQTESHTCSLEEVEKGLNRFFGTVENWICDLTGGAFGVDDADGVVGGGGSDMRVGGGAFPDFLQGGVHRHVGGVRRVQRGWMSKNDDKILSGQKDEFKSRGCT